MPFDWRKLFPLCQVNCYEKNNNKGQNEPTLIKIHVLLETQLSADSSTKFLNMN